MSMQSQDIIKRSATNSITPHMQAMARQIRTINLKFVSSLMCHPV